MFQVFALIDGEIRETRMKRASGVSQRVLTRNSPTSQRFESLDAAENWLAENDVRGSVARREQLGL